MKLPLWIIAGLLACNTGMMVYDRLPKPLGIPRAELTPASLTKPVVQEDVHKEVYRILVEREARKQAG